MEMDTAGALLSHFGEVVLSINRHRQVASVFGDTQSIFNRDASFVLGTQWLELLQYVEPEVAEGLYWLVEAAFEGYVLRPYLPEQFPVKPGIVGQHSITVDQPDRIALRFAPNIAHQIDGLLNTDLRPALSSTIGFTEVLLMGIGGPLSDIQLEDLNTIYAEAQFSLKIVEDWRSMFIVPSLHPPVPVRVRRLLEMDVQAVPRRRFASHGLTFRYDVPPDVLVYSNGAIRNGLINLVRSLPRYVLPQSEIGIATQVHGALLEVHLSYRAAEPGMRTQTRLEPTDLFERRTIKRAGRLQTLVSSLHSQLLPYGCSAWALPNAPNGLATIVATVPLWQGPEHMPLIAES